ncbi:extracellular solute-binding protein [Flexibacterium corallicola]|uniref:extracellular solute-binding protein n=1 Tax=Flexibacterium corallicola TaxID=3037259 RepID=UPI00286FA1F0|nr:extracellular solute-binding protein [Pseudovibrio sp. M1P-2-3]
MGLRLLGCFFVLFGGCLSGEVAAQADTSDEPQWRYASSLLSTPKYEKDFKYFDYVNPDAPKGGTARLAATGTFDSTNWVLPKGTRAAYLPVIYDTLMVSSMDEDSVEYGLLAEALQYPEDYSWVKYQLREGAHWHDGVPITPDDVKWSFEQWTALSPQYRFYYQNVQSVEVTGPREVTFTFDQKNNRELPKIVGQITVLPKHWWTGKDAKGKQRDISKGTLEVPLGSGPYRLGSLVAGKSLTYERVPDYWGRDLPVNVGQNNFDKIRFDYYRDETVELEAFKADQFDWRREATAKNWATAYDTPAVRSGQIIKEKFIQLSRGRGLMVGFIPNLRREKFQDTRVRRALNYALNFQEMNRTIFFGLYDRINSYFFGTELAARGLPEGLELQILEKYRSELPETVFTTPYTNPVANTPKEERQNLRKALSLFKEAGYVQRNSKLVNAKTGEPFTIEYLMNGNRFERIGLRYQTSLRKIGIELKLRTVDSSQYVARLRSRDYDFIYTGWAQSLSPGNEQRDYWGSAAADVEASQNYAGIKNSVIDDLVARLIQAKNREELVAMTRALDRVLLAHNYVVPGWTSLYAFVAHWDRFGRPEKLPEYAIGFPDIWWYDQEKAAKIERQQ